MSISKTKFVLQKIRRFILGTGVYRLVELGGIDGHSRVGAGHGLSYRCWLRHQQLEVYVINIVP